MPLSTNPLPNRRRHKRFQIDLPGTVHVDGRKYPVTVSDISSGGALVYPKTPVANLSSAQIILTIEDFGSIPGKVVRTGNGFWGVCFMNPHQHSFKLNGWLNQEVNA